MIKEDVIKQIKDFNKEVLMYTKNIEKFKKKLPEADMYFHLSAKLKNVVLVKKYGSKVEFFKVDRIFAQHNQTEPLIELEKWSMNCWSSSSNTKIGVQEFIKYYIEIDEDYINEEIEKYKIKQLDAIKKLKKDTLTKIRLSDKEEKMRK